MIVEIGMFGIMTLYFIISYICIKKKSIKAVGICKKNLYCSGGCKGMFEYEIEGKKYYNGEKQTHFGFFKEGQECVIYVNKKKPEEFVSKKVVNDLLIFIIFGISIILFMSFIEIFR